MTKTANGAMSDLFPPLGPVERPALEMPHPDSPREVAETILGADFLTDGFHILRYYRGEWWDWNTTHWSVVERDVVERDIWETLGDAIYYKVVKGVEMSVPWNPNTRKVADVRNAMAAVVLVENSDDMPGWLDDDSPPAPVDRLVSVQNGILDVGTRHVHPHTPAFFNSYALPFEWNPNAPAPVEWLRFLATLWPGDEESVQLLREWFGYVLSGRTDLHKFLMLIGAKRSGKGTIARVLQALVGRGNYAGPALSDFGERFGLAALVGKPLAVIGDARIGPKTDTALAVSRILSITGEDALTVDRKYKQAWTGTLPTRLMLLSNELPRLTDSAGALSDRPLILRFSVSHAGREDHGLGGRLLAELPGILRWALDGADQLAARGRFVQPTSATDEVSALGELTSPVVAFLNERCGPGGSVSVDELWSAWRAWAMDNGHPPGSKQSFGRALRAALPEVRMTQPRVDGGRVRYYFGLHLLPPPLPSPARVPPTLTDFLTNR